MLTNRFLFGAILAIGIYNTVCYFLYYRNSIFMYNSFLLTVLILSCLAMIHLYYTLSEDILKWNTRTWTHAVWLMTGVIVFDYFFKVPRTVLVGDLVLLGIILIALPIMLVESHFNPEPALRILSSNGKYFRKVK